jgi:hypothetical protein
MLPASAAAARERTQHVRAARCAAPQLREARGCTADLARRRRHLTRSHRAHSLVLDFRRLRTRRRG